MARKSNAAKNPGSVEARINERVGGLQKLPATTTLDVAGVVYTPAQLITELQTCGAKYQVADLAHRSLSDAVKDRDQAEPGTLQLLDDVDGAIRGHFGATSSQLADFGMKPKKAPRKLTSEELVARKDKAAATRAENHPKAADDKSTPPAAGSTNVKT